MNYPVKDALIALLNKREDLLQFTEKIDHLLKIYPRENTFAMYVPLGSHDTERILTALGGDLEKLKLAYLFQFAYPGAPAIYYGDEVGLEGGRDPECRGAFPWDPAAWRGDLHLWVRELIAIRKSRASLRRGDFSRIVLKDDQGCFAFTRTLGDERTLVVLNIHAEPQNVQIPVKTLHWQEGQIPRSLLDHRPLSVVKGKLQITLPPLSGMYIG
jgi:cyclomaltodextrinase